MQHGRCRSSAVRGRAGGDTREQFKTLTKPDPSTSSRFGPSPGPGRGGGAIRAHLPCSPDGAPRTRRQYGPDRAVCAVFQRRDVFARTPSRGGCFLLLVGGVVGADMKRNTRCFPGSRTVVRWLVPSEAGWVGWDAKQALLLRFFSLVEAASGGRTRGRDRNRLHRRSSAGAEGRLG